MKKILSHRQKSACHLNFPGLSSERELPKAHFLAFHETANLMLKYPTVLISEIEKNSRIHCLSETILE